MPYEHFVDVLSDGDHSDWSVKLAITNLHTPADQCKCCDGTYAVGLYSVTITEMYSKENGADVAHNAKVYRFAKKTLDADGKKYPYCPDCRYRDEIIYYTQ